VVKVVFDGYSKPTVYFEIQAGEGGKESQSCAEILQRMYLRFFAKQPKWIVTDVFIDSTADGIRKALWKIEGKGVNKLIEESGNHRFTRASPYSKTKKLHTSFVGIKVEEVKRQEWPRINEKDVEMSFFRGSGAGGQHRNKVETGVRLVHVPTGIVAEAVSERSQHQNREIAWERLMTKIANQEIDKRNAKAKTNWESKGVIGFGERRRSYKLDANIVKDEQTGNEIRQVDKILNGGLELVGLLI